jgi:hypothetical protein
MRIIDNKILFSATDLCNFLECEHLTSLDKINLTTPLPQTPDGEDAKLFQNKGFEHEQSYQQKLSESGIKLANLFGRVSRCPQKVYILTILGLRNPFDILNLG